MQHIITRIVDALTAVDFQDEVNAFLQANPDHRLMRLDAVPMTWEGGTVKVSEDPLTSLPMEKRPEARKALRIRPPAVFALAVFEDQKAAREAIVEAIARRKQDPAAWQAMPNPPSPQEEPLCPAK